MNITFFLITSLEYEYWMSPNTNAKYKRPQGALHDNHVGLLALPLPFACAVVYVQVLIANVNGYVCLEILGRLNRLTNNLVKVSNEYFH